MSPSRAAASGASVTNDMPPPAAYPLALAVESVCALGLLASHRERTASMRQAFEERTGAFGPDDAWFEARSRAFWDDALTRQGFARHVVAELPEGAQPWAEAFAHAHRGLFYASLTMGRRLVTDLWSGAEFIVDEVDEAMRTALDAPAGPFDGRLVA